MKVLVRISVSLICSVFGALTISVAACNGPGVSDAMQSVCRSHVELIWLLSMPLLFGLTFAAVAERSRRYRRYVATALLGVYGLYGVAQAIETRLWWVWVMSACSLVAAIGVLARRKWAAALVWILALIYVGQWGYGIYLAAVGGYFKLAALGEGVLSLLPGTFFFLMAGYCCYAVTQRYPSGPFHQAPDSGH